MSPLFWASANRVKKRIISSPTRMQRSCIKLHRRNASHFRNCSNYPACRATFNWNEFFKISLARAWQQFRKCDAKFEWLKTFHVSANAASRVMGFTTKIRSVNSTHSTFASSAFLLIVEKRNSTRGSTFEFVQYCYRSYDVHGEFDASHIRPATRDSNFWSVCCWIF